MGGNNVCEGSQLKLLGKGQSSCLPDLLSRRSWGFWGNRLSPPSSGYGEML